MIARLQALPWTTQAAIYLNTVTPALAHLEGAPDAHTLCAEALQQCWQALTDEQVSADQLARYLDSDELQNGPLCEFQFPPGTLQRHSLILLMLVVGYCAHQLYLRAGQRQAMSASISEAGDGVVAYIVEYVEKAGLSTQLTQQLATLPTRAVFQG